jgi:malonyl-CoA O-methyltransferase
MAVDFGFDSLSSDPYKEAVATTFGQAADRYQQQAEVQRHCAELLWRWIDRSLGPDFVAELPPGPILEIGCGTGFVSRGLVDRLGPKLGSSRSLYLSDLSAEMLKTCAQSLGDLAEPTLRERPQLQAPIQFLQLDGESTEAWPIAPPSLIIGGFVVQWFRDPIAGVLALVDRLAIGGWLVLSFPSCHSFRQWRDQCEALGLPFTANVLPDPTAVIGTLSGNGRGCLFQQEFVAVDYRQARDFFADLRDLGTGWATGAGLSSGQLRRLMRTWDARCPEGVAIDYHAVFVAVQR